MRPALSKEIQMKKSQAITPQELKVMAALQKSSILGCTARDIADLLTIQNESACGYLYRLGVKGFVRSRKAIIVRQMGDVYFKSRKIYFLSAAGKKILQKPYWQDRLLKQLKQF